MSSFHMRHMRSLLMGSKHIVPLPVRRNKPFDPSIGMLFLPSLTQVTVALTLPRSEDRYGSPSNHVLIVWFWTTAHAR